MTPRWKRQSEVRQRIAAQSGSENRGTERFQSVESQKCYLLPFDWNYYPLYIAYHHKYYYHHLLDFIIIIYYIISDHRFVNSTRFYNYLDSSRFAANLGDRGFVSKKYGATGKKHSKSLGI